MTPTKTEAEYDADVANAWAAWKEACRARKVGLLVLRENARLEAKVAKLQKAKSTPAIRSVPGPEVVNTVRESRKAFRSRPSPPVNYEKLDAELRESLVAAPAPE